jgi:hypothetical protein
MEITLTRLTTKNLATLASRSITISAKPEYTVVVNNPLLERVKTVYGTYDGVYAKGSYSGIGSDVAAADHKVDSVFSGIKTVLLGYCRDAESTNHQDAMDLYAIVAKYGTDIDRHSYSEETAQMKKLIEELDQPVNVAKLERVHLTENFARLKAAEAEFSELFGKQVAANAVLHQTESASSLRRQLEGALRNYYTMVSSMRSVDGWAALDAELNEAVKAARNSVLSPVQAGNGTAPTDATK